jgi:hypothetical protein
MSFKLYSLTIPARDPEAKECTLILLVDSFGCWVKGSHMGRYSMSYTVYIVSRKVLLSNSYIVWS